MGKTYAIVLRVPDGDSNNYIGWLNFISDHCEGGNVVRTSAMGDPWLHYENHDFKYRIWGELLPVSSSEVTEQRPAPDETVGGMVYPIDQLALLAPWIGLGVIFLIGSIFLIRRSGMPQ